MLEAIIALQMKQVGRNIGIFSIKTLKSKKILDYEAKRRR